jgi:DNA-binding FadR family transcriptional regulator
VTAIQRDEFRVPAAVADRRHMRLVELIEARDGAGAEDFWRSYLSIVGERLFGRRDRGPTVLDLLT